MRVVHSRIRARKPGPFGDLRWTTDAVVHKSIHRCGESGKRSQIRSNRLTPRGRASYTSWSLFPTKSAQRGPTSRPKSAGDRPAAPNRTREFERETHLPAPQPAPQARPRLSRAHGHEERPPRDRRAPQERPQAPHSLVCAGTVVCVRRARSPTFGDGVAPLPCRSWPRTHCLPPTAGRASASASRRRSGAPSCVTACGAESRAHLTPCPRTLACPYACSSWRGRVRRRSRTAR